MGIVLAWATWVHEYMDILVNIDGERGVLKELKVCDFEKNLSACQ